MLYSRFVPLTILTSFWFQCILFPKQLILRFLCNINLPRIAWNISQGLCMTIRNTLLCKTSILHPFIFLLATLIKNAASKLAMLWLWTKVNHVYSFSMKNLAHLMFFSPYGKFVCAKSCTHDNVIIESRPSFASIYLYVYFWGLKLQLIAMRQTKHGWELNFAWTSHQNL